MKELKEIDIEAIANAVEADEGGPVPGIREGLADLKAGRFAHIHTPTQLLLKAARAKTGLTQQEFAQRIATPVTTLRDWEQGRFVPPGSVTCLINLITKHPELIHELEEA
jgi:putative transcriptional regulator